MQQTQEISKPATHQPVKAEKLPLLEAADSLLKIKETTQAILLYDSAERLYLAQQRWQAYLQAVNKMAAVRISSRDFNGALDILLKGKFNLKDSLPPCIPLEVFYTKLGNCYFFMSDVDSAQYYYQHALKINQTNGDEDLFNVINIYEGLGNIERYSNHDYTGALKYYEKINALLDQMIESKEKKIVEFHCYYNLATTNRVLKNVEKALFYGSEAVSLAQEIGDQLNLQLARDMLSNIYKDQGQYDKSINISKSIVLTYEDTSLFDIAHNKYYKRQYFIHPAKPRTRLYSNKSTGQLT